MRKVERTVRKKVLLCALFLMLGWFLHADVSSLLLDHKIRTASNSELEAMVVLRNLPIGSSIEMRQALYAFHDLAVIDQMTDEVQQDTYRLTIESADSLETDSSSSLVLLEGNVKVSFFLEGDKNQKILRSDAMLIDLEKSLLSATGSVVYEDQDEQAALSAIEGSIVSFNWSNRNLIISNATTSTTKTNSDDVAIHLFTYGKLITYRGEEGGILYERGFLATREKDPLSSIRAEQLAFLSGGDLMVRNATLNIGRIPVFWTPFFFFPSNRMVGNPSIGFASDRGMFVSTTWEIWGTYPHFATSDQNSFTLLLSGSGDQELYPSGVLYTSGRKSSAVANWAAQSKSYFTLFADAYESSGLYFGYDSKSSFQQKKIVLDSTSAFAVYPDGKEVLNTTGSVPTLRYWGRQSVSIDTSLMKVTLQLPYYSDPSVLKLYGNRLSVFSFDALLGKEQDFPTTYKSDVSSYIWSLNSSIRFPVQRVSPYISTLSITKLDAQANWAWKSDNGIYKYQLQKVTLPSLHMRAGGTLFSLKGQKTSSRPQEQVSKEIVSLDEDLLLPAALVPSVEQVAGRSIAVSRNLSLSYTFNQQIEHTLTLNQGSIDWQNDRYLYALSKGSIVLQGVPDSRYFSFSQELLPQFDSTEDQSKLIYQTQKLQLFSVTKAQIPVLGLSYQLSHRLYRSETQRKVDTDPTYIVDHFAFDASSVTVHQVKFERSLSLGKGTLRPSITANLYPLVQSMLYQVRYTQSPYSVMMQYRVTDSNGALKPDLLSSEFGYIKDSFSFTFQQRYDAKRAVSSFTDALSFTVNSRQSFFDKRVELSQRIVYQVLSSAQIRHYFDRISLEAKLPNYVFTYNAKGSYDDLKPVSFQAKFNLAEWEKRWWRRRISANLALDTNLFYSFEDRYASYFEIQAKFGLRIAEFADFYFSAASANTGFFHYFDAQDDFSLSLLWKDLLRSFDFTGDGRYDTQFNLSSLSVELVHYLSDWSLNCKYTGSVVLSNNQYAWVPTFSVFLKWITIPELDVEETWKRPDSTWMRTSTT